MKLFKNALKTGLQAGAVHFRFVAGKVCEWEKSDGTIEYSNKEIDATLIQDLFKAFFPQQQQELSQGLPATSVLNVINHGDLKLIGVPTSPERVEVFVPPEGERLFQQTLDALRPESTKFDQLTFTPADAPQTPEAVTEMPPPFPIPAATPAAPELEDKNALRSIPFENANSIPVSIPPPPMEAHNDLGAFQLATPEAAPEAVAQPPVAPNLWSILQDQPDEKNVAEGTSDAAPQLQWEFKMPGSTRGARTPQPTPPLEAPEPLTAPPALSAVSDHDPEPAPMLTMQQLEWNQGSAPMISHTRAPIADIAEEPAPTKIFFGAQAPGDSPLITQQNNAIDALLKKMIEQRASDVHLTLGQPVVFRIDGEVTRITAEGPLTPERMEQLMHPIMPERNVKEFVKTNDTDFAYEVPNVGRFRVNMFRDINGVGAVLRTIPSKVPTFEQLKLPDSIKKLCELNKGLVLVTGPTGSGKSTTLAAMIDYVNRTRREHIITVEDPVEFVHEQKSCLINQREVHRHTQGFSRALRAALREDPDIVLIGELRDLETMKIAIETAETGHLVFGTLHTNTAISTIDRVIDQFPADQQAQIRVMLAESLRGVIAQTLLKKKTGGRVAAHEILMVSKPVSAMIREGKTHMLATHMQTKRAEGNQLLNDALMALVTAGQIDMRDAYLKSVDKEGMATLLQKQGFKGSDAA